MGLLSKLISFIPNSITSSLVSDGEGHWWQGGGSWSTGTLSGETVDQDNLMTSAACYACTKALAETTAGLPGTIYRTSGKNREEDQNQPAYELLSEQPNPEMDSFTFFELLIARLVNRGNFFAEIQRDRADRPIALWPIHNSRVQPMRDPEDGSLYWQIAGDYNGSPQYDDPSWRDKHLMYLSPHNMLNVVGFGSQNGVIAPGMLPAANEIAVDFATRRYGGSFFDQGAKLQGVVEHPGFIDNEGKRNLFRQDINRIHSSRENAHGVGVLWQGAKYNQISVSPEQAQFLETRRFSRNQICEFYGVPPAIIGDYTDSKFATADAMIRAFVMLTLRNLVVRVEKAINRQVLNVRGEDGRMKRAFSKPQIFNMAIDGLLRGDPKMQAETHRVYRESGIMTTNEIREEIGFNPVPGEAGDYIIVQGGMARLDKIDEQGTRPGNAEKQPEPQKQDASLPEFDRVKLAEMIQSSGLVESPVIVRGATLGDQVTGVVTVAPEQVTGAIIDTATELAQEATTRIHQIALSQIERWREQDPAKVGSKLPDFWAKQETRLREALQPCDNLARRFAAESNLTESIVAAYAERYSHLDNYQIFDAAKTAIFSVTELVQAEMQ